MMTIGIVVPTLNRVRKTRRFIDCLARQTFQDFHLYLIDSGSTDGTRDLPDEGRVPCTLIKAGLDDWWSSSSNMGIKQAIKDGCDKLLTINDDSIILPDYLEKFNALFDKYDLSICANRIDFADEPGKVWALGSYSIWASPYLFQLRFNGWWEDQLPEEIKNADIVETMAVCGDGVLIHKRVFDKIGFFNEKYTPQVHGDSEFSMRAMQNGIDVYVAPNIVLYNDIYNLSENDFPKATKKQSILRVTKELFFWKKSDLYWVPVIYIVWKYGQKGTFLRTVFKFYIYKIMIFYRQFARGLVPVDSVGTLKKISPIRRWFVIRLLGLLSWAMNAKNFDPETSSFARDDKWHRKVQNDQYDRIRNLKVSLRSVI